MAGRDPNCNVLNYFIIDVNSIFSPENDHKIFDLSIHKKV